MTVLTQGDIAIIHASADGADQFSFVLQRDIDAGTVINFTDNGWRAAGGFRSGEGTVTYTASAAMAAGSVITLSGLDLDAAGDQIIAYQGDAATPTILYLVDFADGNNTVAGDATDANTTALPPGFTLGVNAVAVGFDNAIYAGPIDGSPPQLFPLISNSANWIDGDALPPSFRYFYPAHLDLDANNSTSGGVDYRAEVTNDSSPVPISDTDSDIDDFDGGIITFAQITINNPFPGDVLSVIGTLPFGIIATPFDPFTGTLALIGFGSHSAYETAIEQIGFSTDAPVGVTKSISVWVFDDFWWSNEAHAIFTVTSADEPPDLDLDANNSTGFGVDAVATYAAGGAAVPVTDTDVLITDDGTTIQSATINILDYSLHQGDTLSIAGTLPTGITASPYNAFSGIITLSGSASLAAYQTALRQVVFSSTLAFPSTQNRDIQVSVNDGFQESNFATMHVHVVIPPPNAPPVLDLDLNNSTTTGANYLTGFTESVPPVPVAIVDGDVRITDLNNLNLASATITLTNPQAGDHLTFAGTPPPGILVFGTGTNLITLTGVASQGNYQLALQQVRYSNDSVDPSNVTRTIEVVVNDGIANSNTATALVQVEAVNNSAPVIDLDPDNSTGIDPDHFPDDLHGKRVADSDRRHRYHHHRSRQHHAFLRDDHAAEPAGRRSADGHSAVAGCHRRFGLRSRYRRAHVLRRGHAGCLRSGAAAGSLQQHQRQSRHRRPPHRGGRQRRREHQQRGSRGDHCRGGERPAGLHRRSLRRLRRERRARCALPARRAHRPRQCRAQPGGRDHHRRHEYRQVDDRRRHRRQRQRNIVYLRRRRARDGPDRREFAPELPEPAADRRIRVNQRQPDGFRREADADPDVDRIGWRGRHDRDDDAQYRRRERCPAGDGRRNRVLYGERGAGRALAGVDRDRRRQHHSRLG